MEGYRDLLAWQKAMELVTEVYQVTSRFPKEELYGLTSQMRRAAISIPSNIAEGHGRNSKREFHVFLGHARGSLCELETQIEVAKNLGYVDTATCSDLLAKAARVARLINGLRQWSTGPDRGKAAGQGGN
jgi:four helix bundle protein